MNRLQDAFLQLVRLGIATSEAIPSLAGLDWKAVEWLANEQGLLGVMLDGVEKLPRELRPEKKAIIQSIGQLIRSERQYEEQEQAAAEMALLLHQHGIRTYVLKGAVVAECYPRPKHRRSVDMDCFLLSEGGTEDVWEKGNKVIEDAGFRVGRGYYKNSAFYLPSLMVENHRFLTPCRGDKNLTALEGLLQRLLREDNGEEKISGSELCRPPVMVSALFLVEHAYSHFLHEGLNWRHILDWMMFSKRHNKEIDWKSFDAFVDEFGFRKFYDSYLRLGQFLVGEMLEEGLHEEDKMMLADVWAPLDLHESLHGLKAKIQLAGNYWRARWKYRILTDMSWVRALIEWTLGALFDKEPRLN